MAASKLLVYRTLASPAQIRITSGVALAFFLLFTATLFFRTHVVPPGDVFVPITSTILVMAYWITATLLIAQAMVLHAPPLQVLAAGYFLSGLFLVLRVLAVPGIVIPPGPSYDIPLWFYLASHAMLPLAIIAYARPSRATDQPAGYRSPGRTVAGAVIVAGSLIMAASITQTTMPWTSAIYLTASVAMFLIIAAMVMLGLTLHSVLDLWLLLVLWGWLLETALIVLVSRSFTAGWYAARCLGLFSGLFVLFALLVETAKLYAQTVRQLEAQDQEREHRSLIRDAITASIAHELRQPLSSILLNAHVSRNALTAEGGTALPPGEMAAVLDDIVTASKRANDIIESTRTIFGRESPQEKTLTDVGTLLQGTLAMVAGNARANDVLVELAVEGEPKPVEIKQLQVQQALLNLFQNAVEALSRSTRPHRNLKVRCMPWMDTPGQDRGVIIRVEDNGPGIPPADRERIFDVFFTTRSGGTGMGLAIARSVIEAHGGRLTVEPRSPSGTAFVIHLPHIGDAGGESAHQSGTSLTRNASPAA